MTEEKKGFCMSGLEATEAQLGTDMRRRTLENTQIISLNKV